MVDFYREGRYQNMNTVSILAMSGILLGMASLLMIVLALLKKEKKIHVIEEEDESWKYEDNEEEDNEVVYTYEEEEDESRYAFQPEPEEEVVVEDRTVFDFHEQTSKQEEVKQEFVRPSSSDRRRMIDELISLDDDISTPFGADEEEEEEINLKHFEPLKYNRTDVKNTKNKTDWEEEKETLDSISERLNKMTKQFDDLNR